MSKVKGTELIEYFEMRRKQSLRNALIIAIVIFIVFISAVLISMGLM